MYAIYMKSCRTKIIPESSKTAKIVLKKEQTQLNKKKLILTVTDVLLGVGGFVTGTVIAAT